MSVFIHQIVEVEMWQLLIGIISFSTLVTLVAKKVCDSNDQF